MPETVVRCITCDENIRRWSDEREKREHAERALLSESESYRVNLEWYESRMIVHRDRAAYWRKWAGYFALIGAIEFAFILYVVGLKG